MTTTGYKMGADGIPYIPISPDASLDFTEDWTDWLATGETISSASWVTPSPLVVAGTSKTATTATINLAGAILGGSYIVTCTMTASTGRVDSRSIRLNCLRR